MSRTIAIKLLVIQSCSLAWFARALNPTKYKHRIHETTKKKLNPQIRRIRSFFSVLSISDSRFYSRLAFFSLTLHLVGIERKHPIEHISSIERKRE